LHSAAAESSPWLPVHPTYVKLLCAILRDIGIDADAVLGRVSLHWDELVTSDRPLDLGTVQRIGAEAVRLSGRPWLGLELGQRLLTSTHGPVGYAIISSRDLRQAIEVLCRYGGLRMQAIAFDSEAVRGGCVLRLREIADLGELRHLVHDAVFATVLQLLDGLGVRDHHSLSVALPRPHPAWAERYRRLFSGRIDFGAPQLAWSFDDTALDQPNPMADAHDHEAACRECERALASARTQASYCAQVRDALRREQGGLASLEAVAAELQMSGRTLMRKLKREGSSYQALLDEVRQERALWYLRHTQLSVARVAERLGYVDTSNFSRTFRQWFGTTPTSMRAQSGAPPAAASDLPADSPLNPPLDPPLDPPSDPASGLAAPPAPEDEARPPQGQERAQERAQGRSGPDRA
jgi:AraC-like DNA-binding protein